MSSESNEYPIRTAVEDALIEARHLVSLLEESVACNPGVIRLGRLGIAENKISILVNKMQHVSDEIENACSLEG